MNTNINAQERQKVAFNHYRVKKIKNRPTVKVDDTTGFLQTIRLIVTIKCNAK